MQNFVKVAKTTLRDAVPDEDWKELLEEPVYEEYVTMAPNGRWGLVQIADNGEAYVSYIYYDRDSLTHRKTTSSLGQSVAEA